MNKQIDQEKFQSNVQDYKSLNIDKIFEKFEFYKNIVDKANVLIHIDDLEEKKLVWGNGRFKEITGFTAEEISEMGFEYIKKYYHPDDILKTKDTIEFFKNNKGETHSTLFKVKNKDEKWLNLFTIRNVFEYNSEGLPKLLIAVSINIDIPINTGRDYDEIIKESKKIKNQDIIQTLTLKEFYILQSIVEGKSNKEIIAQLNIKYNTLQTYKKRIMVKLDVSTTRKLITLAKEYGF